MNKACVICGREFDALGKDKTCGSECSKARKNNINRHRRANDPEYRARNAERMRARYANDPEYRARSNEIKRARYANDPEFRAKQSERNRARYENDPEFRARIKEMIMKAKKNKTNSAMFWRALSMAGAVQKVIGNDVR